MNREIAKPALGFGLVGNSSSRRWQIAVDEMLDSENTWLIELEGPTSYLVFQANDVQVIRTLRDFLRNHLQYPGQSRAANDHPAPSSLELGSFGTASVSMHWDNEELPRCFLVVGIEAKSTLRLTFLQEDIQSLIESLDEVELDVRDSLKRNNSHTRETVG